MRAPRHEQARVCAMDPVLDLVAQRIALGRKRLGIRLTEMTAGFTLAVRCLALTVGVSAAFPLTTATAGSAGATAPCASCVEVPEFSRGCVPVFVSFVTTVATTWTGAVAGGIAACVPT